MRIYLMSQLVLILKIDYDFRLPNGHINFEKFWQLAKQVTEFIAWKQVACPFEKNPRVIAFLQASPVLTENSKQYLFSSVKKIRTKLFDSKFFFTAFFYLH